MKMRQIPLIALRAFAVTAQTGSVSRAAEELSVTHGAVSRHLGHLEEWIGQKLFVRHGRRLKLTAVGAVLAARSGQSLTDLVSVCAEIRGSPRRRQISIVGPATFTMYWLMPRIGAYEMIDSDVEICLTTRMANDPVDFFSSDLIVTRGLMAEHQQIEQHVLFDEMLNVMASPEFLAAHVIATPHDVMAHPQVAALSRPSDWSLWLNALGIDDEQSTVRYRFDHQFVAMHAVREGLGTIVAPSNLFQRHYVVPFPEHVLRGQSYCLYYHTGAPGYLRRFIDWLIAEARKSGLPPAVSH